MNVPKPIRSERLNHDHVHHGFFTREGGVSTGIYAGLNVGIGSDDTREVVMENRKRVANAMGVSEDYLFSPFQIHSPEAVIVSTPWKENQRPQADALVTNTPGVAIGVLTADCGPVLFLDPENQVAGAAHAGWKGATGGVLENTIEKMEMLGAKRENITAVLGPTISAKNYEVGPEFVERLIEFNNNNADYLQPSENENHAMFDLPAYIVDRLNSNGVSAHWTGDCTYENEAQFFSYRRKTHRTEADYGRQISVISLKD